MLIEFLSLDHYLLEKIIPIPRGGSDRFGSSSMVGNEDVHKSAKRITFSQGFGHFSSIYFGPSLLFQIVNEKIFNFWPIDVKIDR
jgi:hypothetical protein